ncbi:MAG: VWA domain-containing protein [Pirellulales bacterium]
MNFLTPWPVFAQADISADAVRTTWGLQYGWPWPPWLTLLAALFAVAVVAWCYAKESPSVSPVLRILLAVVRLGVVALLALMLSGLTLTRARTGKPTLCLLVDDSGSMSVSDQSPGEASPGGALTAPLAELGLGEPTRLNLVKAALLGDAVLDGEQRPAIDALAEDYSLEVYRVAVEATPLDTADESLFAAINGSVADGTESRIGTAVEQVIDMNRSAPPSALVLLSDGRRTSGASLTDAATTARRRGVPLIAVGVGRDQPSPDLALRDLLADDVVFLEDQVQVEAKLVGEAAGSEPIDVRLVDAADGRVLASDRFSPRNDAEPVDVSLTFRPARAGPMEVILEATPLAGELRTDNNRLRHRLSVREQQIRVLLVSSAPSYEYRFLRNLLQRDPAIKLDTVLQEADPEYAATDSSVLPGFPVGADDLAEYDVVILGDVNPDWLPPTAFDNLERFVTETGGGLAVISGPRFMPAAFTHTEFARLLPVELGDASRDAATVTDPAGYTSRLTLLGENTPFMRLSSRDNSPAALWDRLPPMFAATNYRRLKPASRSLAEHPTRVDETGKPLSVIALHYAGAGQVLFHGTDETWRWRYRTGDVYMTRYWVQAIRHLARTKYEAQNGRGELRVDRPTYQQGETVTLDVRLPAGASSAEGPGRVTAVIEKPSGETERVELAASPGRATHFEATLDADQAGEYRVRLASPLVDSQLPSVSFSVTLPAGEMGDTRMDAAALHAAAELTSGTFLPLDEFHHLANVLPPPQGVPIETLPPQPLWNRWPVLLLLVGLLTLEWLLRQCNHML